MLFKCHIEKKVEKWNAKIADYEIMSTIMTEKEQCPLIVHVNQF